MLRSQVRFSFFTTLNVYKWKRGFDGVWVPYYWRWSIADRSFLPRIHPAWCWSRGQHSGIFVLSRCHGLLPPTCSSTPSKVKWIESECRSVMSESVTPWTIQSMEFSKPEYWSGEPFPSPGDLPNPGIEPRSPTLQVDFYLHPLLTVYPMISPFCMKSAGTCIPHLGTSLLSWFPSAFQLLLPQTPILQPLFVSGPCGLDKWRS